jgi:hypothetical protein
MEINKNSGTTHLAVVLTIVLMDFSLIMSMVAANDFK